MEGEAVGDVVGTEVVGDVVGSDVLGDVLGEALGNALGEALGDALGNSLGAHVSVDHESYSLGHAVLTESESLIARLLQSLSEFAALKFAAFRP